MPAANDTNILDEKILGYKENGKATKGNMKSLQK